MLYKRERRGRIALKKCKECGKEVSTKAAACPNCGAVLKKKTGCLTYFFAGFVFLVLLVFIGSLMTGESKVGTKKLVTLSEYHQIINGMSYRGVVGIIGAEGEELSRNFIEGVPSVMESVDTVMYQWANRDGSNMNAMFQNDRLMQKAQFGLK